MNRLYVIESGPTITGALADHRFPVRSSDIAVLAQTLASGGSEPSWLPVIFRDLDDHRGRSIVIAGETSASGGSCSGARPQQPTGECRKDSLVYRAGRVESRIERRNRCVN